MKDIPIEIRNLALHDASVNTALRFYYDGVISYEKMLENLVEVLAKQKKELQDMNIKLAETSIAPKKFYVNMSQKEIDELLEHGQIELKKPIYEDVDHD